MLANSGADLLAIETIPSKQEIQVSTGDARWRSEHSSQRMFRNCFFVVLPVDTGATNKCIEGRQGMKVI